jgi:hypothetical protein
VGFVDVKDYACPFVGFHPYPDVRFASQHPR